MMEGPGRKPATFDQILEAYQPDRYGIYKGYYLLGDVTEGGAQNKQLYVNALFMPGHGAQTALAWRLEKVKGAQIVAASIANDYSPAMAETVLREVHRKTNRELWKEVTRGDLHLLDDELKLQLIKDDLAGNWASAAKEYSSIPWPDSDAKVGLRDVIHTDHIQRSTMHFDEKAGTLTLIGEQGDSEENKRALARFIDKHFDVKPGHPAFQNIANNVLSYLPRRGVASTLKEAAQKVAADVARKIAADTGRRAGAEPAEIDSDAVRRGFRLEVEEGNVIVRGNTYIPYRNVPDPIIFSKDEFQRREAFKISGEHLRVDPTAFDAKANLLQAVRYDNVVR